mgnify:CR=1 FL=1
MSEETQEVVEEATKEAQAEMMSLSQEEIQALVSEAVEKEVQGLKSNNKALKEEKKKFQAKANESNQVLEQIGGSEELEKLLRIKSQIEQDEEVRLFTEGDREAYNNRITQRVKAEADARITALQGELDTMKETTQNAVIKYQEREIENEMNNACSKSSVKPHLFDAVKGQIRNMIQYDKETDTMVCLDSEGLRYGADGSPMKVGELVETLREIQPEMFVESKGSGALGGLNPAGRRITNDNIKNMSMDEYKKLRSDGVL